MSSMYDRYRNNVEVCRYQLNKSTGEDAFMDGAAFSAQQALEFLIKYIIEEHKGQYKRTHNIRSIYDELTECCNMSFSLEKELLGMSDTITSWESESRYGKGVVTTVKTINRCLEVTERLDKEWLSYRSKCGKEEPSVGSSLESAIKSMSGE